MKVEIERPFQTAVLATLGVFAALVLLILAVEIVVQPDVDSAKVRTICAPHGGVDRVDDGASFMQWTAFVTCRDGWYERADN